MEDRQEPGDHGEVRERRRSSLKEQYVQNLGGKRIVELFRKLQVVQKNGDKRVQSDVGER